MPDQLDPPACDALRRVLGGTYIVTVDDNVTAVFAPLPGRCAAAATRVDGQFWVMVDLDKPLALHHARAMINDYRAATDVVDLGDDDLNRDWQFHSALLPLPRPSQDEPLPVTPNLGRWAAMAAAVLTGASMILDNFGAVTGGLA